MFRLKRRSVDRSPRIALLEVAVNTRYAASRLGILVTRLRNTYLRTGDEQIKVLLNKTLYIQAALEVLAVKLETRAEIGLITGEDIALTKNVLEEIKKIATIVNPGLASMLAELDNMTTSLASLVGIEPPTRGENRPIDEETRLILERARVAAEERLNEILGNGKT